MKKIKVAVVIPTHTNINSSLHVLLSIYWHLMRTKNVDVTIFTCVSNKNPYPGFKVERIKGIDHVTLASKALFVLGLPRFYYSDLVEKLKGYDIIETSNPEFYIFAYQSYIAAKKYGTKLVLRTSQTVEGFYLFKISKHLVIPFARKAYDYASWLLFTNLEAAQRAEKLGLMEKNSRKRVITGHAVDTKIFKPMKVKKNKKPVILSVAGLYEIKGHHLIIKAFAKVRKNHDAELWIVGTGYYKKNLERLAEELGVKNCVKFLGSKTREELAIIYNKADIFALANFQEITPAVNEALACSVPVAVMECGGRKFVIPDGTFGLVAKRFDTCDMANQMIKLLDDRKFAKKLAEKGRSHIIKNFGVEKVAAKFYRCFVKQA